MSKKDPPIGHRRMLLVTPRAIKEDAVSEARVCYQALLYRCCLGAQD